MHLDNKTIIHRGVDFTNQRGGGLILNWDPTTSTTAAYQIEGGDICFLHKKAADATARMINAKEMAISIQAGAFALTDAFEYADKIYICYQGNEESESTLFANQDLFVKMKDLYLTFELKDVVAANYALAAVGDNLTIVAATGEVGTSSMNVAPFTGADIALFPQPSDNSVASAGTKDIVVAKATDTDTNSNTVYLVTVVV